MKKRIKVMLCLLSVVCSSLLTMPVIAATTQEVILCDNSNNDIQPRTDIKEWKYAVIDGNLYKRLYNYTRNRWEGDWILVAYGE